MLPGPACSTRAPRGAVFIDSALCRNFTVVESRTAEPTPISLTTVYTGTPGACTATETDLTFYRLGALVAPGDGFAEVKRVQRN